MYSQPKVLIIGQPFTNNSGGGITQSNLFNGWDKAHIAVVCTSHMFKDLNTEICDTYYLLGEEEYKWTFPFNLIQRKVISGPVKAKGVKTESKAISTTKLSLREKVIIKYFYPFLEYIGVIHSISALEVSKKLKQWLDEYKPDVIYAQASTRESVLFCSLVHEYVKKPMVFHMMDDWPATISEKGPFKNFWKNTIDREFKILLSKCTVLLSISDYMAQEYKKRYGMDFTTFHNPIQIDFWKSNQRKNYLLSESPSLLYAGRIGPGIQASLESIAEATDLANAHMGTNICFQVQTGYEPEWIGKYKSAQYKPPVKYEELPKVFAEADFLILPYDFSEESIKFIGFSMPTKAPEYMMSGTPIIIYSPEVTAIVKDAQNNKWAKIVTDKSTGKLAQAIKELYQNEAERKQIAETAINIAETKFNSIKVRNQFQEIIKSLV